METKVMVSLHTGIDDNGNLSEEIKYDGYRRVIATTIENGTKFFAEFPECKGGSAVARFGGCWIGDKLCFKGPLVPYIEISFCDSPSVTFNIDSVISEK
jgi:hypothetical protein